GQREYSVAPGEVPHERRSSLGVARRPVHLTAKSATSKHTEPPQHARVSVLPVPSVVISSTCWVRSREELHTTCNSRHCQPPTRRIGRRPVQYKGQIAAFHSHRHNEIGRPTLADSCINRASFGGGWGATPGTLWVWAPRRPLQISPRNDIPYYCTYQ